MVLGAGDSGSGCCGYFSILSFCFSFVSNFLSLMPSCPTFPLLPLNWNKLSHSILFHSPLLGWLVAVGLGFDRIYDGPIIFMEVWYVLQWVFVGLIDFCFSFPGWWWWCGCGFVILVVRVVVWGGGDNGSGWMGFVSIEVRSFFFFWVAASGWAGFVASGLWWLVVGGCFFFFPYFWWCCLVVGVVVGLLGWEHLLTLTLLYVRECLSLEKQISLSFLLLFSHKWHVLERNL